MKKKEKKVNGTKNSQTVKADKGSAVKSGKGQRVRWLNGPTAQWLYPLLLIVAASVVSIVVITKHDSDTLFRIQEQDLFLYTPHFLNEHLSVAGGLLSYVGSYFTQFCYHPWVGALLLSAWGAVLAVLVWRTFRISSAWAPVLLVPIALLLTMNFSLGYWIFYVKLHGHVFMAAIGFSLVVALLWLYRSLPYWWRMALLVLTPIVLYPLIGFYALLATVLMGLMCWWLSDMTRSRKAVATVVALLLTIGVPLLCYRLAFCRTSIADIWTVALPLFSVGEDSYYWHYLPYALMCLLLAGLSVFVRGKREEERQTSNIRLQASRFVPLLHLVVIVAMGYGTWHFWYKDANFHRELQMSVCVDHADWQGVLDIAYQSDDEPTRMMVMSKNLAVFKLGQAGNQLYNYREGAKAPASDVPVRMVQTGGKIIYLHYGVVNFCYRWCMEDGVEYGWKVEYLKDMLRSAIVNGEKVMAQKYIDLLGHTRYYGEWAAHYKQLIAKDENLKEDPELGPVLRVMNYPSTVASDRSFMETFLLTHLSSIRNDDPVCTDLALMASMQMKDIDTFWRAFFPYAQTHEGEPMPRHYQEAAYMYGQLEKKVDTSRMPFDKSIVENYQQFMQFAQQCQGMDELQMREAFYPRFGNTFFYNYYLFHNLQTN